jgi:hypothetical protein
MMVKVRDAGVQTQKFLYSFSLLKPLLTSLLSPSRSVFLPGDVVAPGRGDHLLVIDHFQSGHFTDCSSGAAQPISVNDLWNVVSTQNSGQEGFAASVLR